MTILGALMGFLLLSGGTMALPALPAHAAAPTLPNYKVTLTAYNAVSEQTDNNPFETASGAYSNPEVIAARSPDLADELPFGTIIELDGPLALQNSCGYGIVAPIIGYRVVADTMSARYTKRVDILFSTESNYTLTNGSVKNAGTVLGICSGITVRVVGRVNIKNIPKTQTALAAIVNNKDSLALK